MLNKYREYAYLSANVRLKENNVYKNVSYNYDLQKIIHKVIVIYKVNELSGFEITFKSSK